MTPGGSRHLRGFVISEQETTMDEDEQRQPTPQASYHDRASARTPEEREEHFQAWLVRYGEPYAAAVIEAGDKPWFDTVDDRRKLFMRRYTRPAPPVGLSIPRIAPEIHAKPRSPVTAIDDTQEIPAA
jgi:hypothetical protein